MINNDCLSSKDKILKDVETVSGKKIIGQYNIKVKTIAGGQPKEIRQLVILRCLSMGKVTNLPCVDTLKTLFVFSAISSQNCLGYQDC